MRPDFVKKLTPKYAKLARGVQIAKPFSVECPPTVIYAIDASVFLPDEPTHAAARLHPEKKRSRKKRVPLLALPFLENFHAKVFHLIDDPLRFLTGIEQLAEEPGISCPKLFLACH